MPPKENGVSRETEASADYYIRSEDTQILDKLFMVLDDLQATFRLDPKALGMLRPAYKKAGFEFAVKYREDWHSYAGRSLLEALIVYYHEIFADEEPPPTPLRKGGRTSKTE